MKDEQERPYVIGHPTLQRPEEPGAGAWCSKPVEYTPNVSEPTHPVGPTRGGQTLGSLLHVVL